MTSLYANARAIMAGALVGVAFLVAGAGARAASITYAGTTADTPISALTTRNGGFNFAGSTFSLSGWIGADMPPGYYTPVATVGDLAALVNSSGVDVAATFGPSGLRITTTDMGSGLNDLRIYSYDAQFSDAGLGPAFTPGTYTGDSTWDGQSFSGTGTFPAGAPVSAGSTPPGQAGWETPNWRVVFTAAQTGMSGATMFLIACAGLAYVGFIALYVAKRGRKAAQPVRGAKGGQAARASWKAAHAARMAADAAVPMSARTQQARADAALSAQQARNRAKASRTDVRNLSMMTTETWRKTLGPH
jgi:hypothetical protein